MTPHTIVAPAKLNLFLHVTGKRPDGYHLLESLTFFTEFGDTLTFEPSDSLSLTQLGSFAPALEQNPKHNLVLRAAKMLQHFTGCTKGAHITLHKNIPVGAGLGGGSADAAATLHALQHFWNTPLDTASAHSLAAKLGSDVPACLLRAPGWVTGTGEHVAPTSLPAGGWALLVNPCLPLLTADVFRAFTGSFSVSVAPPSPQASWAAMCQWAAAQTNALEAPAIRLMPAIADILKLLAATPHCLLARMSGSGATCFALYDTEAHAQAASKTLNPNWWHTVTALQGAIHGQAQ